MDFVLFTEVRLIPTYAGNTEKGKKKVAPIGAHPHVCGEHLCFH